MYSSIHAATETVGLESTCVLLRTGQCHAEMDKFDRLVPEDDGCEPVRAAGNDGLQLAR